MNILLAHTHIQQNCGVSTYVRKMAGSLSERGHAVHIAALDTPTARSFLGDVAPFVGVPLDQYAKTLGNFLRSVVGLFKLIRREKIDVVVASHRWPSFVAYFVTRFTNCRLVSVDHNVLQGNRWLTFWGDGVISISKECRQHLIDYFVCPQRRSA